MTEPQDTLHFLDYWRVIRARKEIVMAVSLLVVAAGIVITLSLPKVYMASCIIQVTKEAPDVPVFRDEAIRYDPLFLRTQFEIIQSGPVIEETVRRLGLHDKLRKAWGLFNETEEKVFMRTVKFLTRKMKVQQYRDTDLIEIRVYLDEPKETVCEDVARVASTIAEAFRDKSMKRSYDATDRALKALHDSLEMQKERIIEAELRVDEIRQKYEIDMFRISEGTESTLPTLGLQHLEATRIKVRLELEDKKARYEKVSSLSPEKLRDAVPILVGDPALSALVAAKRQAEVELNERLKASLGSQHPDVLSVKAVISGLEAKIDDALQGLETGVRVDYEAAKAKLDAVTAELDARKTEERSAEAGGYRELDTARQELNHARRIAQVLELRYIEEQIELKIPRTTVQVIEPAKAADKEDPSSPNMPLNVILSILVGLASGVGLAYFIEYLDTSVKTIEDIERFMGTPVIGVIPQKVKAFIDEDTEPAHAEAYRVLRANIQFSEKAKDGKTFCFTSGSVGEGKSLTLFNLAYACAQFGDKVLIVDSDLHRPRQHRILGVTNAVGLANMLAGEVTFEDALISTQVRNVDFLSSGKLGSAVHGLLDTEKMRDIVSQFKQRYDFVFFDAPPVIGISDASVLAREVDGVLLVIQHRKYPRAVSNRAKDMLGNVGANLVGVVLNNINISKDYSYYYHHYYYHYYSPKRSGETAKT